MGTKARWMLLRIKDPLLIFEAANNRLPKMPGTAWMYSKLFDRRYENRDVYVLSFEGKRIKFSTKDSYSKHWFFPRFDVKGLIHEPLLMKLIAKALENPPRKFVDVGTHLGYFTCLAAKMAPECKVYGFEMDPNVFKILKENVAINSFDNVEVHNYAISDKEGYVEILQKGEPDPKLSLKRGGSADSNRTKVKSITLDDYFKGQRPPELFKIDVEGAELLVLKGMKNILKTSKPEIFLELHGNRLAPFNTNSNEIISFLIDLGYTVSEVVKHRSENKGYEIRTQELSKSSQIDYNAMLHVMKKD